MSFMKYEIGGNEVKIDASEAIADIPENRTLLVEKLTDEEAISPEIIGGLNSINEVFDHYKPCVEVEFENTKGQPVKEKFCFKNVSHFSVDQMTQMSSFLSALDVEGKTYDEMIKQMRSNKVLQRALADPEAKKAFVDALTQLSNELDYTLGQ